jgi:hypothetical protein
MPRRDLVASCLVWARIWVEETSEVVAAAAACLAAHLAAVTVEAEGLGAQPLPLDFLEVWEVLVRTGEAQLWERAETGGSISDSPDKGIRRLMGREWRKMVW